MGVNTSRPALYLLVLVSDDLADDLAGGALVYICALSLPGASAGRFVSCQVVSLQPTHFDKGFSFYDESMYSYELFLGLVLETSLGSDCRRLAYGMIGWLRRSLT